MAQSSSVTVSFPFLTILCLIFIALKLTNFIAWSWWWVLCPLWVPVAVVIVFFLIAMLFVK